MAKARPVDIEKLLSNPFGDTPLALVNGDGSLCKTSKVALLHKLEELADEDEQLVAEGPYCTALIIDTMADLHSLPLPLPNTFGGFSSLVLKRILAKAKMNSCSRVDFVVD